MNSGGGQKVIEHPGFRRDLKRLLKKYPSLRDDLKVLEKMLLLAHQDQTVQPKSLGFFRISGLGFKIDGVYIAKKFACRSLKGSGARSGIRVVYRFNIATGVIEYIEMFHKKEKPMVDKDRIKKLYLDNLDD